MEAVLFIGVQGAGKTTFYRQRFADTHIRISMDMLRTRHREAGLYRACLAYKQPVVVDNTNPTVEERQRYIAPARAARFRVIGYCFRITLDECLARNLGRPEAQRIPERGVRGTFARLVPPSLGEGFDALYWVTAEGGAFRIEAWNP